MGGDIHQSLQQPPLSPIVGCHGDSGRDGLWRWRNILLDHIRLQDMGHPHHGNNVGEDNEAEIVEAGREVEEEVELELELDVEVESDADAEAEAAATVAAEEENAWGEQANADADADVQPDEFGVNNDANPTSCEY